METITRINSALSAYNSDKKRFVTILGVLSNDGAFSTVFEVTDRRRVYVMKAVDTLSHGDLNRKAIYSYTVDEIRNMRLLSSETKYIMKLYDSYFWCSKGQAAAQGNRTGRRDQGGVYDGVFLLFMPKLMPCLEVFRKNGFSRDSIVRMGQDICRALSFCHRNRILHRDVKPENIFYSPEQSCFVLSDLGISRRFLTGCSGPGTVTMIGTRSTIAPEIREGKNLEGRYNADIYSLGMTMSLLLEGCYSDSTQLRPLDTTVDWKLKKAIRKATRIDPKKRYQSAESFYRDLSRKAFPKRILRAIRKPVMNGKTGRIAVCLAALVMLSCMDFSFVDNSLAGIMRFLQAERAVDSGQDRPSYGPASATENIGFSSSQDSGDTRSVSDGQPEGICRTDRDAAETRGYGSSVGESGKTVTGKPDPPDGRIAADSEERLSFAGSDDRCRNEDHGKVKNQYDLDGFIYWNGQESYSRSYIRSSEKEDPAIACDSEPLHHVYLDFSGRDYRGMAINISLFGESHGLNMVWNLEDTMHECYISEGHYSITAEVWNEGNEYTCVYETIDIVIDHCGCYYICGRQ